MPDHPRQPKEEPAGTDAVRFSNSALLWWVPALLLVLGTAPAALEQSVRVVPAPADAVLAPGAAWSAPVSLAWGQAAEWPSWLYAAAGAALIAIACSRLALVQPVWVAVPLLLGWSTTLQPHDLIPAAILMAAVTMTRVRLRAGRPWAALAAFVGWGGAGLLLSIEFGWILLAAGLLGLTELPAGERAARWKALAPVLLIALLVVSATALLVPGFLPAGLRPVNWLWMRPDPNLLPSMAVPLSQAGHPRGWIALIAWLAIAWWAVWRRPEVKVLSALFVLSLIGLACGYYLWLATLAVAIMPLPSVAGPSSPRLRWLVLAACLFIALSVVLPRLPQQYAAVVHEQRSPQVVDPTQWDTGGPVLLMDLEQASDWQGSGIRQRYRLLVDDRWDIFADTYSTYAGVCDDLGEIRSDGYLRTDGSWGGYQRWLNRWSPTLIVADSSDVDRIRRMSVSPHWSIMSIDARRTIFGLADIRLNLSQRQRAVATLYDLEWPSGTASSPDERVIVASGPESRRKVAAVLCGIRLPYAGLRVLPDDHAAETETVRTWCYVELAHRVRRHSGESSLLDQYRAVARLRESCLNSDITSRERRRIDHSLAGLGLPRMAELLSRGAMSEPDPERQGESSDAEGRFRAALRAGDSPVCEELLPGLEPAVRDYYRVLMLAAQRSLAELYADLSRALHAPAFPKRLRGEALFYLGCLAIEAGDPVAAIDALHQSEVHEPGSPFADLREMYLKQLSL